MEKEDLQLLQGTLDVLVLKTLSWKPSHGYAIARWIKDATGGDLHVEDRALYISLHRMAERGWIESEWRLSENNRQAKYYRLTREGRRQRNTRGRLHKNEVLLALIESISSELELRPLLTRILLHACDLIGADDGAMGLFDAERQVVRNLGRGGSGFSRTETLKLCPQQ